MKNIRKRFFKDENGGIEKVIGTASGVAIVLMLIVLVVLPLANSAKETGKVTNTQQRKINLVLENEDYSYGINVKDYSKQQGISVTAYDLSNTKITDISAISDTAIFEETGRSEDSATGKLSSLTYRQVSVTD
ncbi:hypothetical protein [Vallitalea guaymasensis]|uniref:hypothetical protein n=1 Tax=Vallitalea guaymasensis TaxID=1185412 RepID=UPI000DE24FB8|nr:hypothetical protein [Vallitalea guaymasensis]